VSWSHEFSSNCNTTKNANWISGMVELCTVDLHVSSTSYWASQWSNLR
jgi:hypothetical protein